MRQQISMKHGIMVVIMLSFFLSIRGQTISNQTVVIVESGLTVEWEGDLIIAGRGDIDLDGTLNLGGDLINTSLTNINRTGTGSLVLNGTSQQAIGGNKIIRFFDLTQDNNSDTRLNQDIEVDGSITMTKGLIDLNGKTIDLGSAGRITSETNTSRITGNSGKITLVRTLNNINEANLAGIGLALETRANMGSTRIERTHQERTIGSGRSTKRSIQIEPTNNSNLNARVRLYYFSGELNGHIANGLKLFRKPNGSPWTVNNASTAGNGFVEGSGYNSLGLFTMSSNGTTALEDLRPALSIRYFPNPLTQGQQLQIEGLEAGNYQLELYDLTGKQVWQQQAHISTINSTEAIDLPNLTGGLYSFRILSDKFAPTTGKLHIHSH